MLKKVAIFAAAMTLAAPAVANDRLAKELGVEPGFYTLNELVQIKNTSGHDRKVRIELINRQKAAFDQAVADYIARNSMSTSTSTLNR